MARAWAGRAFAGRAYAGRVWHGATVTPPTPTPVPLPVVLQPYDYGMIGPGYTPRTLVKGSTYLFKHVAYRDGSIWDLTDLAVTLKTNGPADDDETDEVGCDLTDTGAATAEMTFDIAGRWRSQWFIDVGNDVVVSEQFHFGVEDEL